jgi:hypothetical protein
MLSVDRLDRARESPRSVQLPEQPERGLTPREQPAIRCYEPDRRQPLISGKPPEQVVRLRVREPDERELVLSVDRVDDPGSEAAEPAAGVVEENRARAVAGHLRHGTVSS